MTAGLESLHKILKDDTRRQTLTILSERGSLSYTELMEQLNLGSTGTLNYHLKVLGDLLTKNDAGHYFLSEKGEVALRMLKLFPAENDAQLRKRRQKQFWTVAAASQMVYFATALVLYSLNFFDLGHLLQYTMWFFGGLLLAYLGYRMQDKPLVPGSEQERRRQRLVYPLMGGTVGLAVGFFGPVIATVISINVGGPNFLRITEASDAITVILTSMVVGAAFGYYLGKRNKFRKPKWVTRIDERFGF